jgi:hypothetical protein
LQYRNGYQAGQAACEPALTASHRRSQAVRPRPNHDQFNPLMTLQFGAKTSTLRPLQETERMSSVLKKRRKKMRKHKYKKLRRRQKFERRKS